MKNCKHGLLAILLVAFSAAASATPGNNGGGNGGCGNGQQTNGCGGSPTTNAPVANGGTGIGLGVGVGIGVGQGGQGGAGGRGGDGGNAAVIGSGNSSNLNVLGQQQGQMQGQAQSSRNTNQNENRSNSISNSDSNAHAFGGSGGSSDNANTVVVGGDVTNIPKQAAASAASVYVNPPSSDVCQRAGFGLSLQGYGGGGAISAGGSESDSCETRADAINLKYTGAPEVVIRARQCQNAKIAKAFEDAGMPCPKSKVSASESAVPALASAPTRRQPKPWEAGG